MATQPQFTSSPRIERALVTTAEAALDGSGNVVSVFTAGGSGSYIANIVIKAIVSTTAGMIRIFTNQSGAYRLLEEVSVTAITKSATVKAFSSTLNLNLPIPSGTSIGVSTEKAESFVITVEGGDY